MLKQSPTQIEAGDRVLNPVHSPVSKHDKWLNANIVEVVQLPQWQMVRARLEGKWVNKPQIILKELRKFLGPIENADTRKLRIVANYYQAVVLRGGFKVDDVPTMKGLAELYSSAKKELDNRV